MNASLLTGIGSAIGALLAIWTMFAHFDKRNADRFDALQKQAELTKELLRAEMREMRAELRLEIERAGERRISR